MIVLDISSFFGRLHPLLVHLPIGFLILSVLIETYSNLFKNQINNRIIVFSWFLGFISSAISALFGWFLAQTGLYIEENLYLHKLFGFILVGISFFAWIMRLSFFKDFVPNKFKLFSNLAIIIILFITGHNGGNLTHGENYLFEYAPEEIKNRFVENHNLLPEISISLDSIKLYSNLVEPILINKCISCHNNELKRGNLDLSSLSQLIKGGNAGSPIDKINPRNSLIFKRIVLPIDNIKFMPPDGPIVSYDEINTILWWIKNSDKSNDFLSSIEIPDEIKISLNKMYSLDFSDKEWFEKIIIQKLDESKLVNIDKSIFQIKFISGNKKFVSVKYLKDNLSEDEFNQLNDIKDHIAYLFIKDSNLSDKSLLNFLNLKNLVNLDIQKNSISDEGVKILQKLENLEVLNLYGTKISKNSLETIESFKNLKRVYVWDTKISKKDLENFNRQNTSIELVGGI